MPDKGCTRLREFSAAQRKIIVDNIEQYKLDRHIYDDEEAKTNFVESFGWIMREIYCGFICCKRITCPIAHDFLPQPPNQNEPVPQDIMELAIQEIIRRHLDEHKWFRHIADAKEATRDFLNEFGRIIVEMISNFPPQECAESSTPETSGDAQGNSV